MNEIHLEVKVPMNQILISRPILHDYVNGMIGKGIMTTICEQRGFLSSLFIIKSIAESKEQEDYLEKSFNHIKRVYG